MLLADHYWTLALLILGHWIVANAVGFISLALSFTRLRHTGFVLVSVLIATIHGGFLSAITGL